MSGELLRDYSKRYWDVANLITGFAVAQSLAFVLAYGSDCVFRATIAYDDFGKCATLVALVAFPLAEAAAVCLCHWWERQLLSVGSKGLVPQMRSASRCALGVRILVIFVFGALAFGVVFKGLSEPLLGPGCEESMQISPSCK